MQKVREREIVIELGRERENVSTNLAIVLSRVTCKRRKRYKRKFLQMAYSNNIAKG